MAFSETEQQYLAMELADTFYEMFDQPKLRRGALGELRKAFEYFRITDSRKQFLAMLDLRQQENQPLHQNKNTPKYYQRINDILREFLNDHAKLEDADLLPVLGWAVRLAQYRDRTESPAFAVIHPPPPPPPPPPPTWPKKGNDRNGRVKERAGKFWLIELEGGFEVKVMAKAGLALYRGDRVLVRITQADSVAQEIIGDIRRVY
jgi:hypothetical protein